MAIHEANLQSLVRDPGFGNYQSELFRLCQGDDQVKPEELPLPGFERTPIDWRIGLGVLECGVTNLIAGRQGLTMGIEDADGFVC